MTMTRFMTTVQESWGNVYKQRPRQVWRNGALWFTSKMARSEHRDSKSNAACETQVLVVFDLRTRKDQSQKIIFAIWLKKKEARINQTSEFSGSRSVWVRKSNAALE